MRARMLVAALVCVAAVPAAADAATLVNGGGRLTYTGEPGEENTIEFEGYEGGIVLVGPLKGSASGCEGASATQYVCQTVSMITADLGDGDDRIWAGGLYPSFLSGGPGDDDLVLFAPGYASVLSGGSGLDAAYFAARGGEPITVTLDDLPNDGVAGARVNVAPDVEDVGVGSSGPASLTGNAGANTLTGGDGSDTLTGAAGSDILFGRAGDDTLDARDGETDRVECGTGADAALVDPFDQVSESCEHVHVTPMGYALVDQPPTVAFAPDGGLAVTATDDRGIANVRFMLGEETICTDTRAPYTCDFRPRVSDVGRRTIVAVAVDAAGQTATAVRTLIVPRFKPQAVSLSVKREGRRYVATGKVRLPGIPCGGEVVVKVGKTTRTAKLSRTCIYRVALPSGGRFVATYTGTAAIEPKRSAARTVR